MDNHKKVYEEPTIELLGKMDELTGSSGYDNDDGWGVDNCA
jgi:hypothetical protein